MNHTRVTVIEELLHVVHRSIGYMTEFQSNGRPTIRMLLVGKGSENMGDVAVWLIDIIEFEFLHHHLALYLERLWGESQRKHAVAFEPKGGFHILCRNDGIVVGVVG